MTQHRPSGTEEGLVPREPHPTFQGRPHRLPQQVPPTTVSQVMEIPGNLT